jgi:hypothetical protein
VCPRFLLSARRIKTCPWDKRERADDERGCLDETDIWTVNFTIGRPF